MKKKKVIKIRLVVLILIIILIFSITKVMGRYVYNNIKDLYLTSKAFYFQSDVLTTNAPTYTYTNWGGTETYKIEFSLYSYKNESLRLNYDLNYSVSCSSNSSKVQCGISSEGGATNIKGVIPSTNGISKIAIYVKPLETIKSTDNIEILISSTATGEYTKTISATIKLKISQEQTTFSIYDSPSSDYAVVRIVNNNHQNTNAVLEFDPKVVRMDMASKAYIDKIDTVSATVDGSRFAKKVKFPMQMESTYDIKFYKIDSSQDYTYPKGNNTSIIKNSFT